MKIFTCLLIGVGILSVNPLLSQDTESAILSTEKEEKRKAWKLEFTYSLNVRNTIDHPALKENWEAFTPEDAIEYKEDRFSSPLSLELNYSPSKYFSIGPFLSREVYKMKDKKKNEWDQAQAPTGTYVPSTYYDVIFESKYLLKFVPLVYGLQARLLLPTHPRHNHFISLQARAGRFLLVNSKYKFNRINEDTEIFKEVRVIMRFMAPLRTTQINLSGSGEYYGARLSYFHQLKGMPNSFIGLELNWQQSVLSEIRTRVTTQDERYPGFSVENPGSPLAYPSFTEGEEGILWDSEKQEAASLDFGGLSLSATLRFALGKGK
ncbi:MAG: hypothetical protein R8P61_09960 [Bacteroidia bacterium]|nr:hypothetical protein [Bacteroidia bacterium]